MVGMQLKLSWFETGTPAWLMSYAKKEPFGVDKLGFPNHEVGDGFNRWRTDAYTRDDAARASAWASEELAG